MAPKYQQIAGILRSDILDGVYAKTDAPAHRAAPLPAVPGQPADGPPGAVRSRLRGIHRAAGKGSGSHILDRSQGTAVPRKSIAVVTTYISNYIFPSILREIESVLARNSSAPTLYATQNQISNERRILQSLLDGRLPDGILVEGTKTGLPNPNLDLYRKLMDRGVPMVFLHGIYPELTGPLSVLDDNYGGGRQLVEYLYGKGHRAISGNLQKTTTSRASSGTPATRTLCGTWGSLLLEDQRVFWYNTENKDLLLSQRRPVGPDRRPLPGLHRPHLLQRRDRLPSGEPAGEAGRACPAGHRRGQL